MSEGFYITTAISYPNGPPHMGHAYEAIATDALARFKRLDGYKVFFSTGTDDHGQKIYRAAKKSGRSPQNMISEMIAQFQSMCALFDISYDRFISTHEAGHHKAVRHMWKAVERYIYKSTYAGWYAVREEEFYQESELIKDENGKWRTPSGVEVEWVEEESYFFKLSAFEDKLLDYYQSHPDFIHPLTRRNEVISFVRSGLKDLSISRSSFDWGVATPDDEHHIVYVWLDALTNYLTACGYPDKDEALFKTFWPADIHIIGKDILRFHAVYWPSFLMAANLALPKKIFAHGMILTGEGEKMSKSLNNVIDPFEMAELYGVDPFRYFLLREIPFGSDGICGHKQIKHRLNADLANDLGNLAQRCFTLIERDWQGKVPPSPLQKSSRDEEGQALLSNITKCLTKIRHNMDRQRLDLALTEIWVHIGAANRYFTQKAPWECERDEQSAILYNVLEVLRQIGILIQPFMPSKAKFLLDIMSIPDNERDFSFLDKPIKENSQLKKPSALFPRYK